MQNVCDDDGCLSASGASRFLRTTPYRSPAYYPQRANGVLFEEIDILRHIYLILQPSMKARRNESQLDYLLAAVRLWSERSVQGGMSISRSLPKPKIDENQAPRIVKY